MLLSRRDGFPIPIKRWSFTSHPLGGICSPFGYPPPRPVRSLSQETLSESR